MAKSNNITKGTLAYLGIALFALVFVAGVAIWRVTHPVRSEWTPSIWVVTRLPQVFVSHSQTPKKERRDGSASSAGTTTWVGTATNGTMMIQGRQDYRVLTYNSLTLDEAQVSGTSEWWKKNVRDRATAGSDGR